MRGAGMAEPGDRDRTAERSNPGKATGDAARSNSTHTWRVGAPPAAGPCTGRTGTPPGYRDTRWNTPAPPEANIGADVPLRRHRASQSTARRSGVHGGPALARGSGEPCHRPPPPAPKHAGNLLPRNLRAGATSAPPRCAVSRQEVHPLPSAGQENSPGTPHRRTTRWQRLDCAAAARRCCVVRGTTIRATLPGAGVPSCEPHRDCFVADSCLAEGFAVARTIRSREIRALLHCVIVVGPPRAVKPNYALSSSRRITSLLVHCQCLRGPRPGIRHCTGF